MSTVVQQIKVAYQQGQRAALADLYLLEKNAWLGLLARGTGALTGGLARLLGKKTVAGGLSRLAAGGTATGTKTLGRGNLLKGLNTASFGSSLTQKPLVGRYSPPASFGSATPTNYWRGQTPASLEQAFARASTRAQHTPTSILRGQNIRPGEYPTIGNIHV